MSKSSKKRVLITLGDPCGIGAEVTAKALSQPKIARMADFLLIGNEHTFQKYLSPSKHSFNFLHIEKKTHSFKVGNPSKHSGFASLLYLKAACDLLKAGKADALVTAPLCKEAVAQHNKKFQGHTEFLADQFGLQHEAVGMMFAARDMRTIIVTRHISLKSVPRQLTEEKIIQTIRLTHNGLKQLFKIRNPNIGVCGLNPHAGENGLLGTEDQAIIAPAIKKCIRQKMKVFGPLSADTLFSEHNRCKYDAVVAMYHDQGLIPIKTLYLNELVNLTLGLPFVRTSPAHGTAFDIAGKNKADAGSMTSAIQMAATISR